MEGGRQIDAAGVLYRRRGGAAVAVSVSVAVGVPMQKSRWPVWDTRECRMFVNPAVSS